MVENNKKDNKKDKKRQKRMERLKRLFNIDLCACAGGHRLRCYGPCREAHRDSAGTIKCEELYQIDPRIAKRFDKQKRGRKRDRQGTENRIERRQREKNWKTGV